MSKSKLLDAVSAFILCTQDNTVLLTLETGNEYYIPSALLAADESWTAKLALMIDEIFSMKLEPKKMLRYNRVWTSLNATPNISNTVFLYTIDSNAKKRTKNCDGKYRSKLRWTSNEELKKLWTSFTLKSPELLEYWLLAVGGTSDSAYIQPAAVTVRENFYEANENVVIRGDSDDNYASVVNRRGFRGEQQEKLWRVFLESTFPAIYMSVVGFWRVVSLCGWPKDDATSLFRAADVNKRVGLAFRELLYFVLALDPDTLHKDQPKQIRENYIFRFFDNDNDGVWNATEFAQFVASLRKIQKLPLNDNDIQTQMKETYKLMNKSDNNPIVSLNDFIAASSKGHFQGIADVLRSPKLIQPVLNDFEDFWPGTVRHETRTIADIENKTVNYEIGVHSVRILKSRQTIQIDDVYTLKNATSSSTIKPSGDELERVRRISTDNYNQQSVTNELLKSLRYLVVLNTAPAAGRKTSYLWGKINAANFCKLLITVCQQVASCLKSEPRLLDVTSPVYVMGDLHGNIEDLLCFEKFLWPVGPTLSPCSLLFLGDYVDRGKYSIEVVTYLFTYKIQAPKKVFLVRGNHEIRDVQKMYTFFTECATKFGDKLGKELWNAINNVFDHMPLAATIDKTIFCCHGGVPPPWLCPFLKAINDIPNPLTYPDQQSALAWEIMWNDPLSNKAVGDKLAMELMANEGFAANSKRGTGHVFSVDALERFLKQNQLSHIIRAHEVPQAGIHVQQKGKLITVFSSSHYCGGENEAACVLADQGKIRVMRLETD